MTRHSDDVYLSVLTLGEIQEGIEKIRGRQPSRALGLEKWLGRVENEYAGRIIPVGPAEAKCWGELSAARTRPVVDALIGATALVHGLTVATRNVRDFEAMDVPAVSPWANT